MSHSELQTRFTYIWEYIPELSKVMVLRVVCLGKTFFGHNFYYVHMLFTGNFVCFCYSQAKLTEKNWHCCLALGKLLRDWIPLAGSMNQLSHCSQDCGGLSCWREGTSSVHSPVNLLLSSINCGWHPQLHKVKTTNALHSGKDSSEIHKKFLMASVYT